MVVFHSHVAQVSLELISVDKTDLELLILLLLSPWCLHYRVCHYKPCQVFKIGFTRVA